MLFEESSHPNLEAFYMGFETILGFDMDVGDNTFLERTVQIPR